MKTLFLIGILVQTSVLAEGQVEHRDIQSSGHSTTSSYSDLSGRQGNGHISTRDRQGNSQGSIFAQINNGHVSSDV